jgi:hypothetical protein
MTTTLALAREEVATILTTEVEGLNIRPRGRVKIPRPGDGWVTWSRLEPEDFTRSSVVLTVIVILGPDEDQADDLSDVWAPQAVDAVAVLPASDVAAEPISLIVDGGGAMNGFTLSLTVEVEQP